MLKEYVAKRLAFLQPQGKHTQSHGKRERLISEAAEETAPGAEENLADIFASPLELEAEEAFADVQEYALESTQAEPEPVCDTPTAPVEESGAEETDFPAGLRAYEAGRYEEAWAAFAGAAELGNRDAQFLCGQMLQKGLTADGGDKPALVWYKRAAKQGHTGAQLACAVMYEMGRGTGMDLKRALFWYEQAAKQGAVEAQLKCGCMYFRGRAETRNPKKARRWLEAAADNGSDEAKQILRERF